MKAVKFSLAMLAVCIASFAGCSFKTAIYADRNNTDTDNGNKSPTVITWYWNESNVQLPEDSYICKKIKEDLNIVYIHKTPAGTDFEEKLELLIASGDIPDVITSYGALTAKLVKWGIARPVEKYLTPEYLPNVIRIQQNWDLAVKYLTAADGHVYAVPNCNTPSSMIAEVPFIRYDWLENLGLGVPRTFEELREVLVRFTFDDPDRNGVDDTIGTMANEFWGMVPFALNFGADHFEWYEDGNGGVTLGMFLERHKDYLRYVKSLIDSGAMDRNIATTKFAEIKAKLNAGKVGFLYQWFSHDDQEEIRKTDPACDWGPITPPAGLYDKGDMPCSGILREGHCVSTRCADVEAVFRLMDYMAQDKSTDTKMDYTGTYWLMKYGEKGVNWDITQDGAFTDGKSGMNPQIAQNNREARWVALAGRFQNRFDIAWRLSLPADVQAMYKQIDSFPLKVEIPESDSRRPINAESVTLPEDIAAFCMEWQLEKWPDFFYRAILGETDIDKSFENFVTQARESGLQEINEKMEKLLRDIGIIR